VACRAAGRVGGTEEGRFLALSVILVILTLAGDTLDRFLDDFPTVKREQAVAALELARDLLTAGRHPTRTRVSSSSPEPNFQPLAEQVSGGDAGQH